jgi:hypothetical protein
VWLESGVVGIVLMGLFVTWLVLRSMKVWRRAPPGRLEIDQSLARAATLIVGLLIAHSFLDYPLRTDAMMAIMAFACALLIDPPTGAAGDLEAGAANKRMMRSRPQQAALPVPPPDRPRSQNTFSPREPAELLGENVEWPDEWREPAKHVSPSINGGRLKPPED